MLRSRMTMNCATQHTARSHVDREPSRRVARRSTSVCAAGASRRTSVSAKVPHHPGRNRTRAGGLLAVGSRLTMKRRQMQVIGAGLPRTGTLSQKIALEMLGFAPCYHMVNVLGNLDLAEDWRRALDGDPHWDEVFDGFQSTVDWPGSYYYRELMEKYPDAKVVLGTRDGESWAGSMRETIWGLFYDDVLMRHLSDARAAVDPKWSRYIEMMKEMWKRSGLLKGTETTDESMVDALDRYHEQVKSDVPAGRLLVWSVAEGWDPLCEFLEVPVPDAPFPKVNDSAEFADRLVDGCLQVLQQWRAENPPATPPAG